jgi:hypothetical protein
MDILPHLIALLSLPVIAYFVLIVPEQTTVPAFLSATKSHLTQELALYRARISRRG